MTKELPKIEDIQQGKDFIGKVEMTKIPIGEYKLVEKELDTITSNIEGSTLKPFTLIKEELQEASLTSSNEGNNIILTLVIKQNGQISNLIEEGVWGNTKESTDLGSEGYNVVSAKIEPPMTIGKTTFGKLPEEFIKSLTDFLTFKISDSQFLLVMPISTGQSKEPLHYMILEKQQNSSNNNTTLYIIIASLVVIILIILFMIR